MASVVKIKGIRELRNGLAKIASNSGIIAAAYARGVIKAGLHLQNVAMDRVPVNTGILRASAFTRAKGTGFGISVNVGFTAAYAIYVHEAPGTLWGRGIPRRGRPPQQGNYWDPAGQAIPKFLEYSFKDEQKKMTEIVMKEIRSVL